MRTINIICVGTLKEKYLREAAAEYEKRLSPYCKLKITELSEYKVSDKPSPSEIERCIEAEGAAILAKIPQNAVVAAMRAICFPPRIFQSVFLLLWQTKLQASFALS